MIGFFPRLYKDELLYSWFARYHLYSANISPKQTMKELYGKTSVTAVADLPTNLEEVYLKIKHFAGPTIEDWIKHHTFYRYYTAFVPKETQMKVFEAMRRCNNPQSLHLTLGINASSISENTHFMFCPTCNKEDLEVKGETYWRLTHQLPGVLLCLKHNQALIKSNIRFRGFNKHEYIAADKANCLSMDSAKFSDQMYYNRALELAKQIQSLVLNDFNFTSEGILSAYKYLLYKKGLVSVNGTVNQRLLAEQFLLFYGEKFLHDLNSTIKIENESCWLKTITRKHRKAFHPIRHLLLINCLGESVESFHTYKGYDFMPFGEGPYYCLNPAADHYEQKVIPSVEISICTDTRKPVGTFTCSCGFIYSRRGPDTIPSDKYKVGRIKQFGHVWLTKAKHLINDQKKSYTEASEILKCNRGTLSKYVKDAPLKKQKRIVISYKEVKRKEWLQLISNNSKAFVTELRKFEPALYSWLYRNDRDWLKENSPLKKKEKQAALKVDWDLRDEQVLKEVFEIVKKLKHYSKPVHINISRIGKEIGKLSLLEKKLNKLPKTKEYLTRITETTEAFQIRRAKWAAEVLKKDKDVIAEWELKRVAGLKNQLSDEVNRKILELINNSYTQEEGNLGFGEN
ncbi:hypothetical protein M670_01861 [Schinkia azotoformans MEV2011]|uniref:Uncharacterized protein n=1 Tax=Schinkia azotoformans MEV2011 TaxID=1348973 RepID=A0A072NZJ6_SCHAZ|nr:TnsD family Tn7-like transposition protein [Schinkia azotoformans]KEF38650.1 hypothetical protein M670_01861 [Schinkia azotoformans MEV2011]MEC1698148.1 TnsD family transposase [Schinkia azotoformans]MEC1714795.1 TnsD family transposase [Schinkia azotoformans]MEC1727096.1 TnsD family transposase [Schinkia azotoformans]MEC1742287.1 TnsD family transposase [Schinkia azotoformans]